MSEETVEPTLTPAQVCAILGVSAEGLQALVDTGRLQEDRVGHLVRFTHRALGECIVGLYQEIQDGPEVSHALHGVRQDAD
jgi:excisionase family DNA binding protein